MSKNDRRDKNNEKKEDLGWKKAEVVWFIWMVAAWLCLHVRCVVVMHLTVWCGSQPGREAPTPTGKLIEKDPETEKGGKREEKQGQQQISNALLKKKEACKDYIVR